MNQGLKGRRLELGIDCRCRVFQGQVIQFLQFVRAGFEVPIGPAFPKAFACHPQMLGMKSRQPTHASLPFGLIDRTSPAREPGRIEIFQHQQDLIPIGLCSYAFGNPGETGVRSFPLPSIPVGFHLIGLEFSLVRQVRVPSAGMPTGSGLDVFYDYGGQVRSLQFDTVNFIPFNT